MVFFDFLVLELSPDCYRSMDKAYFLLLVFFFIQIKYRKYVPWIYWLTVILISIAGTLITDNLVDNFGVPLKITTLIFGVLLIITFAA